MPHINVDHCYLTKTQRYLVESGQRWCYYFYLLSVTDEDNHIYQNSIFRILDFTIGSIRPKPIYCVKCLLYMTLGKVVLHKLFFSSLNLLMRYEFKFGHQGKEFLQMLVTRILTVIPSIFYYYKYAYWKAFSSWETKFGET